MRAVIPGMLICASLLAASPAAAATLVGNRHGRSDRVVRQSSTHGPLAASDDATDVSSETAPPRVGTQSPAISFVAEGNRLNARVVPNESDGDRNLANFRIPPGARQALASGSGGKNGSVVGLLTQSDVPEPATWGLMLLGSVPPVQFSAAGRGCGWCASRQAKARAVRSARSPPSGADVRSDKGGAITRCHGLNQRNEERREILIIGLAAEAHRRCPDQHAIAHIARHGRAQAIRPLFSGGAWQGVADAGPIDDVLDPAARLCRQRNRRDHRARGQRQIEHRPRGDLEADRGVADFGPMQLEDVALRRAIGDQDP